MKTQINNTPLLNWIKKNGAWNKGKRMKNYGIPRKGNDILYPSFHKRVYKIKGKANHCERCDGSKAKRFEWANLTGHYEDINDYIQLCCSCHRKMDFEGKSYSFIKKNPKNCLVCSIVFIPKSSRNLYCGSVKDKIGCSYKSFKDYHIKRYKEKICKQKMKTI